MNLINKKLIRDFKLPISVYDNRYIDYYFKLYDGYLPISKYKKNLDDALKDFNGCIEDFSNYCNTLLHTTVDKILSSIAYKEFINMDMSIYNITSNYSKDNIYTNKNKDTIFLSIDLKKANFQALSYVNKDIVLGANSYEEFLLEFTEYEYILNSKTFRQNLFGRLNAKRQIKVERYLIEKVINVLLDACVFEKDEIAMASNDEVIFYVSNSNLDLDLIKKLLSPLGLDLSIDLFKLDGVNKYFAKRSLLTGKYKLVTVPSVYYPQIFKFYNNVEIEEMDLLFMYEGNLAKFNKPLENY